jgi:hypothetical protein
MELNNYLVGLDKGQENTENGYIELEHDTVYRVFLVNDNDSRCDAELSIDGEKVGTWRIESHDSIVLERPSASTGRFTFYRLGSKEGVKADLQTNQELGLLKCVFTPERYVQKVHSNLLGTNPYYNENVSRGSTPKSFGGGQSAGGTGLSGNSNQSFGKARPIEHDFNNATTIYIRLVCKDAEPNIRPLRSRATNIPPSLI